MGRTEVYRSQERKAQVGRTQESREQEARTQGGRPQLGQDTKVQSRISFAYFDPKNALFVKQQIARRTENFFSLEMLNNIFCQFCDTRSETNLVENLGKWLLFCPCSFGKTFEVCVSRASPAESSLVNSDSPGSSSSPPLMDENSSSSRASPAS
jgi:hypothetical protein